MMGCRQAKRPMTEDGNHSRDAPDEQPHLYSSLTLLERAQAGDGVALDCLIARYLPRLQRCASGRLPR